MNALKYEWFGRGRNCEYVCEQGTLFVGNSRDGRDDH